jgi:hypothetical protein
MKKIFTLLMVASMFSLVACGPSEQESAEAEAEAAAAVEELFDGLEEEIDAAVEEVAEEEVVAEEGVAEEGEHVHAEGEEHDHS